MAIDMKQDALSGFVKKTAELQKGSLKNKKRFSEDLDTDSLDIARSAQKLEEGLCLRAQAEEAEKLANKDNAFYHEFVVTLKDVNLYGTVYFSRYFEWQGIARELYFATAENFQEILAGAILITKYAWNDYIKHIHVFDYLVVKVQNRNIKRCSYEVIFTFTNKKTNEIVARAGQTICFADSKTGRIMKLPDAILKGASKNLYKE